MQLTAWITDILMNAFFSSYLVFICCHDLKDTEPIWKIFYNANVIEIHLKLG